MASFTIRDYPTAEMSEAAYRATNARLLPLQAGAFSTRVNRIEFGQLWFNTVEESAARLKRLVTRPDRLHMAFLLQPKQTMLIDGDVLPENGIVRYVADGTCLERSLGPTQWCAVSMPAEAMALAGVALADRKLSPPEKSIVVLPAQEAMLRLKTLCMEAATLNEQQSALLEIPEVARGLEQTLTGAFVGCLLDPETSSAPRQSHSAALVVGRFHRLIEQHPDEALYMPEVCAAIRVPERTLRLSCHKILGMGPARYLLLRRLHLAHRALERAGPGETTVTDVATRFGFWHFGRFATSYRSLFGERPSATLSRYGKTPVLQRHTVFDTPVVP
jgi:AraC-like DNA-binding protein